MNKYSKTQTIFRIVGDQTTHSGHIIWVSKEGSFFITEIQAHKRLKELKNQIDKLINWNLEWSNDKSFGYSYELDAHQQIRYDIEKVVLVIEE